LLKDPPADGFGEVQILRSAPYAVDPKGSADSGDNGIYPAYVGIYPDMLELTPDMLELTPDMEITPDMLEGNA